MPTERRGRWVVWIVAACLLCVFTAMFLAAEAAGLESEAAWAGWLVPLREGPGVWLAALALVGALAVDLFLPVPSSVVMTLSGSLLGFALGAAVNLIGAMSSAMAGYLLCRSFGARAFRRLVGNDAPRVHSWFERWGPWLIVLSRGVPMLTEIVSCLAGLHRVPIGRFVWLSLLGAAPICVVYAWAGATDAGGLWLPALVALVLPGIAWGVVRLLARKER